MGSDNVLIGAHSITFRAPTNARWLPRKGMPAIVYVLLLVILKSGHDSLMMSFLDDI